MSVSVCQRVHSYRYSLQASTSIYFAQNQYFGKMPLLIFILTKRHHTVYEQRAMVHSTVQLFHCPHSCDVRVGNCTGLTYALR